MLSGRIVQALDLLQRLRLLTDRESGSPVENGLNVRLAGQRRVVVHLKHGAIRARYEVAVTDDEGAFVHAPTLEVLYDPNTVRGLHPDERLQLADLLRRVNPQLKGGR